MKVKSGWVVKLSVALLLVVLTACSGNSGNPQPAAPDTPAPAQNNTAGDSAPASGGDTPENVELRISWWGNADRAKLYDQILDMYEEQNPHVKTVREWTSFNDYWPKLATQIAGGNLPDIFSLHVLLYGGEYADRSVLEPLQPYVDQGLIQLEGWDQAVIDAGKLNGEFYALPKGVTSSSLIVNVSTLKNLELEPPQIGTLGQFKQYLISLREKMPKDQYPMVDASFDDHYIESFVRSKGKSFIAADGKGLGFDREDLQEFWGIFEEFRQLGLVPPAALTAENRGQPAENSLFVKKQVVIDLKPSNHGKIYNRSLTEDELTILRTPGADNGKFRSGENLQAPSWVVSNTSKHKEEAAKLISWFVNDVAAQKIYKMENGIPGSKAVKDALTPDLHPMDVEAIKHLDTIAADIPPTNYRLEGAAEIFTLYTKYLEQVAFGRMSVEQAVNGFFDEAENVLK